ncbi:hypothetical protein B0H17DRAFT_1210508 [Mycena rosella]|uniref:Uncharacterized protein n=1 Tax=Mycena rosella TaxID=1033263 RepID=A0AAD7G789_MYCRO|nr:hypothetical protein B0H17DRAFT_1210508 [Mycena rosella]
MCLVIKYLETLIVPALRRFQIPGEFLGNESVDALQSFISKSGCKLQELLITDERLLPKSEYHEALAEIPNLYFDNNHVLLPIYS